MLKFDNAVNNPIAPFKADENQTLRTVDLPPTDDQMVSSFHHAGLAIRRQSKFVSSPTNGSDIGYGLEI